MKDKSVVLRQHAGSFWLQTVAFCEEVRGRPVLGFAPSFLLLLCRGMGMRRTGGERGWVQIANRLRKIQVKLKK